MLHCASVPLKIAIPCLIRHFWQFVNGKSICIFGALLDEERFLLNGLPTSICMQGHNMVDVFQVSAFMYADLRSSISGLEENTAAANRLHTISILPEQHMELLLILIPSLKPMVSQHASWRFCWFENSHPISSYDTSGNS
ncbi:hypothetical protein T02_6206 [Trichinella nativa]|uniref:Uncharacterized protein n=1 Tax=Trichinella nativa TaxID=6335 RepID=A0A0V1LMA6_9BILA|nr:hypothetical protein T02_6206 [Trichinella nativa]